MYFQLNYYRYNDVHINLTTLKEAVQNPWWASQTRTYPVHLIYGNLCSVLAWEVPGEDTEDMRISPHASTWNCVSDLTYLNHKLSSTYALCQGSGIGARPFTAPPTGSYAYLLCGHTVKYTKDFSINSSKKMAYFKNKRR